MSEQNEKKDEKNKIKFGDEGRKEVLAGVKMLARAVKSTLGPGGRTCAINRNGYTSMTKDGVTVAQFIRPENPFQAIGVNIIRQASEQTAHVAGDGTSTSTLLAEGILELGLQYLEGNNDKSVNSVSLSRGIIKTAQSLVSYIKDNIKTDCKKEQLKHIALVSTNWDEEMSELISQLMIQVGQDGVVNVEASNDETTSIDKIDGYNIERGFISHYFINNTANQTFEADSPLIFMTGRKIMNNADLGEILKAYNTACQCERPLVIVAPEIGPDALNTLIINKQRGIINVAAIKCPGWGGQNVTESMLDLEAFVGGTYFHETLDRKYNTIQNEDFGTCNKIKIDRTDTVIIGMPEGNTEKLKGYIQGLTNRLSKKDVETYANDHVKLRISKLSEGLATFKIGSLTEAELNEKKDRLDDALCACRAALSDGVVAGGGTTLLRLQETFDFEGIKTEDVDFNKGVDIVKEVLSLPLTILLENAGWASDTENIKAKILESEQPTFGFDIKNQKFGDMIEMGIIDPAKVTCSSLLNAASTAGLILTTECLIDIAIG